MAHNSQIKKPGDVLTQEDPMNFLLPSSQEERFTELTAHQKEIIHNIWSRAPEDKPPSLKQLVSAVWGEKTDPRTWQGRLVRDYLANNKMRPQLEREKNTRKNPPKLKPEHEEYIKNNAHNMSAVEMAREIFQSPNLTHLHLETRLVFEFLQANKIKKDNPEDIVIESEEYFPPRNIIQCVARVNKYICQELHHDKLSPNIKKGLHALIAYMSTHRFLHQIKTFTDIDDRILFESEFIRCTYDKEDLTAEEVDQYIVYATEVIIGGSILRRVQKLEEEQDRQIEDGDGRINMALVDAVKSLRDEYNKCAKRQQDLIHSLKIKRSERLSTAIKETASILNLVNMWKEEDSRKQLIELAIRETQGLKDEINRLGTMDELKARILGLSDDEILYG